MGMTRDQYSPCFPFDCNILFNLRASDLRKIMKFPKGAISTDLSRYLFYLMILTSGPDDGTQLHSVKTRDRILN
jgi:hypothetical protein